MPFAARQRQDPGAGAPTGYARFRGQRHAAERFSDGRPVGFLGKIAAGWLLFRAELEPSYFPADVASMVCSSDRYLANGIVAIARVRGWTKPRLKPAVSAPKPRLLHLRRDVGAVEAVGAKTACAWSASIFSCAGLFPAERRFFKDSYLDGPWALLAGRGKPEKEIVFV